MRGKPLAYVASLADGQICYLLVDAKPADSFMQGALLDALALNELEQLTRSVEDALDLPLDWEAIETGDYHPANDQLELNLEFDNTELVRYAKVVLPHTVLFGLEKLQVGELKNVRSMSWNAIPATLLLSEFTLSDQELHDLSEGALVLIAESFQPQWKARLRVGPDVLLDGVFLLVGDKWQQTPVVLNKPSDVTASAVQFEDSDGNEDEHLRVNSADRNYRIELSFQVDPKELMKAKATVTAGLMGNSSEALIHLVNSAGTVFKGKLLPAGKGQAILLEPIDVTDS